MSARYSLRQTPRKKELFDGMIQTPARRSTRRKSQFPQDVDGDSSSANEGEVNMAGPGNVARRRGVGKFVEATEEADDSGYKTESPVATEMDQNPLNHAINGKTNGKTNGSAGKGNGEEDLPLVDGWRPGLDHRKDYSGEYNFGGPLGNLALMVGFPLLMWYMWIGATYYDGKFPLPTEGQDWSDFARHMANLVYTGAFPSLKAWTMYWTFLVVQATLYCLAPGVWAKGKPLRHEGGRQLDYYCSATWSFYLTIIGAATLHVTGVFPLYTLIDEFGPLLSVAICSGYIVATAVYIRAFVTGRTHRLTDSWIQNYFMGAELNPRLFGIFDFKMFFEVRLPWYILFLLTSGAAARQYERYGYVSGEVCFMLVAHWLYANACSKGEELIITTWDMYYEKLGFMLTFWNMAGVPLSYCHCTIFLANHHPDEYRWNRPFLVGLMALYIFVYWVWDTCNSQKNFFRGQERGTAVMRNSFPQLPWKVVKNPRTIKTATGNSILADGWYGLARKTHYTCDAFFAFCWGLVTGFSSPFPWFYSVFFCVMIAHRAWRDINHCRAKYGDAWTEYEKMVPYLFIPYVI